MPAATMRTLTSSGRGSDNSRGSITNGADRSRTTAAVICISMTRDDYLVIFQRNMLTCILSHAARAHHARAIECWTYPSADAYRPPKPAFIQVGPPFAEHLHILQGVLDAGTGPVQICSAGSISSSRAISLFASSSRPASAQLAAAIRSTPWLSGSSRNATFPHLSPANDAKRACTAKELPFTLVRALDWGLIGRMRLCVQVFAQCCGLAAL